MEYSVCASAVYAGVPLPLALPRIKEAGYGAFEFWSWWDKDINAVDEARKRTGLKLTAMCTRFVPLNDPARQSAFLDGLKESVAVAKKLECPVLIAQAGSELAGVERQRQHDAIVQGLRVCAPVLEDSGVTLALEPLNALIDHKGYYLTRSDEGFAIVRETGSPNVKLLFDVYHQQISEGNLIRNLTQNVQSVAHVHIAGNPGRHEPYENSEVHYPTVLKALAQAGYAGYVGLEYLPLRDADESLKTLLERMPPENA